MTFRSPVLLAVSLAAFGFAFIMMQPTLVATAQELMPQRRCTVMSLASFNMFVGGGIGTFVSGKVLDAWGFGAVFVLAAILILLAGIFAAGLLRRMGPSKKL